MQLLLVYTVGLLQLSSPTGDIVPWPQAVHIGSAAFKCGFCGNSVASSSGWGSNDGRRKVYICPHCDTPSFITADGVQVPSSVPGNEVEHLPESLESLFREARLCVSVSANTASVLACRKLLMNIAVQQEAPEGLRFIEYVEYLAENGYVPPNGRGWVDHIRRKGNEATHEIALVKKEEAEQLISFVEMLLKFIYEFPNKIPPAPGVEKGD